MERVGTPGSEGRLLTVIGVLPASFAFPAEPAMDFYTPLVLDQSTRGLGVTLIGRLRDGVSLGAAMDEANVLGSAIPPRRANAAALTMPRFEVQGVKDRMVQRLRPALRLFFGAVVVVLLIVCANVANLLLARGTARQREMAVRLAIGASRARVVRQVLTECLVLAMAGGALGALFGAAAIELVKKLAAVDAPGVFRCAFDTSILPRANEVGIDLKVFGIAFAVAATTSLVFGVLPALRLSRTNYLQAMGSRGGSASRTESRIRAALVVGQRVMATMLLVGAGLLTHSFVKLMTVKKGWDSSNVLTFQLVLPTDYSIARKTDTIERLLARLRSTPNVQAAGFTRAGILVPEEIFVGTFVPRGRSLDDMRDASMRAALRPASPGFLTAMGVPVLDGRELAASDTANSPPVIVISRTVAARYFGSNRAIGQMVDWTV